MAFLALAVGMRAATDRRAERQFPAGFRVLAGAIIVTILLFLRHPQGVEERYTLGCWGMAYTAVFTLVFYPAANLILSSGWSSEEIAVLVAGSTPQRLWRGMGWLVCSAATGRFIYSAAGER